jgi:preprotein translocase subunit SecA
VAKEHDSFEMHYERKREQKERDRKSKPGPDDDPLPPPPETIKSETKDIGRNDPCPCGSGKKYKHCCLKKDEKKKNKK